MQSTHLYDQISRNKRNSWLLVLGMTAILVLVGFVLGSAYADPWIGLSFALLFSFGYAAISYFGGSSIVMATMGAKQARREDFPQLFNVVEEMAIAGGLPIPKVYVIESAASNAFATGNSPEKASIAITTGLLEILNREELQAVIGHEMAHVKNFDTRYAVLMAVMVGAIALLCDAFWRLGRRRSSDKEGGQAQAIMFIAGIVLALLAPLAAKLIQFSMSRKRELLADNTSAELTRNPGALANALEKIATDPDPMDLANRGTQHLFIINPLHTLEDNRKHIDMRTEQKAGWFDTHPPLGLRIKLLREMSKG
jgi:Zn-dependent protease with chaperone function